MKDFIYEWWKNLDLLKSLEERLAKKKAELLNSENSLQGMVDSRRFLKFLSDEEELITLQNDYNQTLLAHQDDEANVKEYLTKYQNMIFTIETGPQRFVIIKLLDGEVSVIPKVSR